MSGAGAEDADRRATLPEGASCLACSGPLKLLGIEGGGRYAWCVDCGAVQLHPVPDPEGLHELYRSAYADAGHYYGDASAHEAELGRVCRQVAGLVLAQHTAADPRFVVEVGAGWGTLTRLLAEAGVPVVALEPSAALARSARERGLPVREGDLAVVERDTDLAGRVRAFVSMAVYEHLADQGDHLRRLAALLPGDGAVVLQCPTAGIPRLVGRALRRVAPARELPSLGGSLAAPWHVCLPTPLSMSAQARAAGLVVTAVEPSLSGRRSDWRRILQAGNEWVARVGHALAGPRWPLSTGHVFVLRKA